MKDIEHADRRSLNGNLTDHPFQLPSDGISLEALETSLMEQALTRCEGNQTRAAKLLGLTRDQFRYRWKKISEGRRPHLVMVSKMPN